MAALGAGLGALAEAQELVPGGRTVSRTTGGPRRAVASTCLQCTARCGILGFVEEGRLVKIEGNPKDPNNRGRLCAKGQAGLNHLYNPDRLLYPVMRVGPRGANVWQRVPWDVANQEVAARLAEIRHSGRPEGLLFMAGLFEGTQPIVRRFTRAFGTPNICQEMHLYQSNKAVAQRLTWGAELELNDVARSRYILNFGANPYESHALFIPLIQRLVEGRMKGGKLVTLDPRLSGTAARSDEWLPIKPGTDGVVALAMANVIIQKGLHDQDFLARWTNVFPAQLAQHLASYTPAMAGEISGLPAATIERIAVEYATSSPATTLSAGGATLHAHGVQTERAISLLNAVTGNIEVPGGYCLPRTFQLAEPEPQPSDPGLALDPVRCSRLFAEIQEGKLQVKALMGYMANPAYSYPDERLTAQVLADPNLVPFFVAVDTYVTETSVLADIILPASTYLESWDIQSTPSYDLVPNVSIMQPVVRPQGESLPFHDIGIELARRIGGGMEKFFDFGSMEAYVSSVASTVPGLAQAGGVNYMKENGLWRDPQARPAYRTYERAGFGTPSRKFELSAGGLEEKGLPGLPAFEPSAPAESKESLLLVTFQWNVHTYGRTAPCMWLSEIVHDNPAWIHPETAEALGIHKGDTVRLSSEKGSVTARAWVTQGVNPHVIAMGACVGHWESGRVAQGKAFDSPDPNTRLIWWQKHGNGTHPYRLVPMKLDPVGGSPAWMGVPVTVEKV